METKNNALPVSGSEIYFRLHENGKLFRGVFICEGVVFGGQTIPNRVNRTDIPVTYNWERVWEWYNKNPYLS